MEKKLNLNDMQIDDLDLENNGDALSEYAEGHGLNEIGASSQSGSNSCGQGSCKTALE
jgi:hypothetical protein